MYLADPAWLLALLCVPLSWLLTRRKGFLGHSNLAWLAKSRAGALHKVPVVLLTLSFISLTVALAQPQHGFSKPNGHVLARDVVFGIDISDSMTTSFQGKVPAPNPLCATQLGQLPPKILKEALVSYAAKGTSEQGEIATNTTGTREAAASGAVENFICQSYLAHAGDRIGLLEFWDSPVWLWPLTSDLKTPYRQAEFLPYANYPGTNFGENPPGPLDFGAQMFKELGEAKSRVFILVTDGEDSLGPEVVNRLIGVIREAHMHFYVIGVAGELTTDADIAKVAAATGGKVFLAESEEAMNKAVETVNKLTLSPVHAETSAEHTDLFWIFAGAFIIFFLTGLAGEALVLKR